ncbi:MAG: hypothetical protein [Bacteriophage sp.]|nr:MAG: hypothetical protein [Bacteriophage sp.]
MEKLFFKMIGEYNTYSTLKELTVMKIKHEDGSLEDLARYNAFIEMSLNVLKDLSKALNIPIYHKNDNLDLYGYHIVYDRISTEGD